MKPHYPLTLLLLVNLVAAHAQFLPTEWVHDQDAHVLDIGGHEVTGLYELGTIRTVELQFSQPDWWEQMTVNQATNTRIPATLIVDGVEYDSVGVRFKGSSSEEIELTQKRSFNIDINYYIPGQNVMGYSKFNLDNCSNDPSFMREVIYSELIRDHVPTSKVSYVHLNINGESWGLYPNIQQLDSPFMREWFLSNNGSMWRAQRPDELEIGSWGDGTAALNWLGSDTTTYQEYYTLERSEQVQPWDALVRVIDKLNNTPYAQLEDSADKYMDLDRVLWFLAAENAFSDRSSYTRKGKDDYFLYYEPESGRTHTIEFDGRTSMRMNMVSWSPFYNADDANYPLLNRLLAVPSIRQRYLAHLRTIIEEKMQSEQFDALVDQVAALIDAEVQADTKKLYTYEEFQAEQLVLKDFIQARRLTLLGNFEVTQQAPSIGEVDHRVNGELWADPLEGQPVDIRATVSSAGPVAAVNLRYSLGLTGSFGSIGMFDDGAHNDGAAGDGVYGATIAPAAPLTYVRYYVEAIADNAAGSVSFAPAGAEHEVYVYQVQHPTLLDPPIRVNEVMAWNLWVVADAFQEYDDWIELYNTTGESFDLSGHYLSDDGTDLQRWQFPLGSVIGPFSYMIIWTDGQPEQGDDHANFALNNNGESVWLSGSDGVIMDHVVFGPQSANIAYARVPNGTGPFEFQDATFGMNNDLVSVPEMEGPDPLRIHPNPSTGIIVLESAELLEFTIYDALLRRVHDGLLQGRLELDLSAHPAGTYYLRHKAGVQKLVLIH